MKKLGVLIILLFLARITTAQTDAKTMGANLNKEPEKQLIRNYMGADLTSAVATTANGKKSIISSAARKSSLSGTDKTGKSPDNKNFNDKPNTSQARRPSASGKPPRVAIMTVPPAIVRKPIRISMPNRREVPSIGRF